MKTLILVTSENGTQYYYNRRNRQLDRADKVIVDTDTEQYHCDESDLEICKNVCHQKELSISDITLNEIL